MINIEAMGILGAVIGGVLWLTSKESKQQHEKHFKNYARTDRGWSDEETYTTWQQADYDVVEIDEWTGESKLIYKGRLSDDPRTPVYTYDDLVDCDRYGHMQFRDGFRIEENNVSKQFHKYFDTNSHFAWHSREANAEKVQYLNGKPSVSEIQQSDYVDIRHLKSQMEYMIFRKGTCPTKWKEHLVIGVDSKGVITAATQQASTKKNSWFSGWYED